MTNADSCDSHSAPSETSVVAPTRDTLASFRATVDTIVGAARRGTGDSDIDHAIRFDRLGRVVAFGALCLAAWHLNPVSVLLVVVAQMGRWGLAHQVLHRAYESIPGCPGWMMGSTFARGWRRYWDWCDWILPDAWQLEHNIHHVHTGGSADPDVVEANVEFLRRADLPRWKKTFLALLIMCTWRLSYYAPSTFIQLRRKEQGLPPTTYEITGLFMFASTFNPLAAEGRAFWRRCIMPYAALRFVLMPALFAPMGVSASINVLVTLLVSEVLINFYSWAIIASTHTGDDIYRFAHEPRGKNEWYLHQVLGTSNYTRSPGLGDWSVAWVNYQIEHHLCPNLTLLQLETISPAIQRACELHGIPYLSAPLSQRFANMFRVVTGVASMRWHERAQSLTVP